MKQITFEQLRNLLEAEENFEEEVIENIVNVIDKQKLFPDIFFGGTKQTEDYVQILPNVENPEKAKEELFSYKFAKAANVTLAQERKTRKGGYFLEVLDEDGDPFDKDIFIILQRGGQFRAGRANELGFMGILENCISKTIEFIDATGKRLVLKNIESVRDCGSDPGSRTGNRADFEIKYDGGKIFKISLKMNTASKAAGVKNHFKPQAFRIGKIVRKYFQDNNLPYQKHISVQITNPELYKWCIFGNDMQKNGALIKTTVEDADIQDTNDKVIFHVNEIATPQDDINELIEKLPFYLRMDIDRRGAVEIMSATFDTFGRKYLIDDLVIHGINDVGSVTESIERQKSQLGIFYGYTIYADYDEQTGIFHTKYKIKDFGLKGMAYINILSITDDEITFRDLKWNEETENYEPVEDVCTVHIEYKEPCNSRKRKSGFGMEEVE